MFIEFLILKNHKLKSFYLLKSLRNFGNRNILNLINPRHFLGEGFIL